MFGKRVPLVRLLGFEIRFDLTWLILVALIVWTLSSGYFPASYRDLPAGTYFWMGVLGAIGLVASIVIHELAHSVVARRFGMEIRGITLFAFGGAAELASEPPTAKAEFWMAVAGPITSVILAALLYLIGAVLGAMDAPEPLIAVIVYLGAINIIIALFNMVPAFPLDGGRVLRAALWAWRGDLRWATRIAANIGGGFGLGLIFLGVVNAFSGNLVGGMWMFLIGLFVRAAAANSYQALVRREVLGDAPVSGIMTRDPIATAPDTPIADVIERYVLGRTLKVVPVVDSGRLLGLVDARAVKALPREQWTARRARDVMVPTSSENTITPATDAAAALDQMQRSGQGRLLVAEGDRLVGIVSLTDIMRALGLRVAFESAARLKAAGL